MMQVVATKGDLVERGPRPHYRAVMPSTLGETIKDLRVKKGWTQDDLAEKTGISKRQISNIENGANTSVENVRRFAAAFGVQSGAMMAEVPLLSPESVRLPIVDLSPAAMIDFRHGLVEEPLKAEVACGEPIDYSVDGESVLIPEEYRPNHEKGEFLVRARGESMVEFGIQDGWYAVIEPRPDGVVATGEPIIAWYEPASGSGLAGVTMKYWVRRSGRKILQGSTPETTFELQEGDIFRLIGIVRRAFPPPLVFKKISG